MTARPTLKAALILAHRHQDWESAKTLSQAYQHLKKQIHCVDCGVRISSKSLSRCRLCYVRRRCYSKFLPST